MNKETIKALDELINQDLENIKDLDYGTKERQNAINEVCNLMTKRAEFEKIENDNMHRDTDEQLRTEAREEQQLIDDKKNKIDRLMKLADWGLRIGMFAMEQKAYNSNLGMLLCYEQSGSFTKQAARNYIRDLRSPRR